MYKINAMKYKLLFLFVSLLFLGSCKKDKVDATSNRAFQSSINDMASSLSTLQQVKFNEALYILKTFHAEGETDIQKLTSLAKALDGMNVQQILSFADNVASQNEIAWSSTGPPSLGEMNIFGKDAPTEFDPNDIKASAVSISTYETLVDSALGPRGIQVVPKLLDHRGKEIEFSGTALPVVLEVFSNGERLLTSKNLMQNSEFKGFTIQLSSLPSEKVLGNAIDVTVVVSTTQKDFKMTKTGLQVNPLALRMPQVDLPVADPLQDGELEDPLASGQIPGEEVGELKDPRTTVTRFLNQISSQNLRGAFDASDNPNWGSYDAFSNPTTGFGDIRSVQVKSISPASTSGNSANVNATYDVVDKSGRTTALQVTFGLKNVNGEWKISSYRINQ